MADNKAFTYDGVISGKKVCSWTCPIIEYMDPDTNKKKLVPDTSEPEKWWKDNYTVENGAFWYKVS